MDRLHSSMFILLENEKPNHETGVMREIAYSHSGCAPTLTRRVPTRQPPVHFSISLALIANIPFSARLSQSKHVYHNGFRYVKTPARIARPDLLLPH